MRDWAAVQSLKSAVMVLALDVVRMLEMRKLKSSYIVFDTYCYAQVCTSAKDGPDFTSASCGTPRECLGMCAVIEYTWL